MNKEIIEYIILIIILFILLFSYFAYITYDNNQKIKYYKQEYSYETAWDKYNHMVKLQQRVIRRKKIELRYLKFLIFMKGLIK